MNLVFTGLCVLMLMGSGVSNLRRLPISPTVNAPIALRDVSVSQVLLPHLAALLIVFALLSNITAYVAPGQNGDHTIISDDPGSVSRALPAVI